MDFEQWIFLSNERKSGYCWEISLKVYFWKSWHLFFAPYYIFKDLITIFIFIFILCLFVFFMPNALGDCENYVMANPMQTPSAIVPEWYKKDVT